MIFSTNSFNSRAWDLQIDFNEEQIKVNNILWEEAAHPYQLTDYEDRCALRNSEGDCEEYMLKKKAFDWGEEPYEETILWSNESNCKLYSSTCISSEEGDFVCSNICVEQY